MIQDRLDAEKTVVHEDSPGRFKTRVAEALFLLGFPLVAYFALHLSPLNQAGFLDPYIYTGYIHNIQDLLDRYGLPYYSVRFGLILPARALGLALGFDAGYLVFRYSLALIAGIPLYLFARRALGKAGAGGLYCALLTSPFLTRSLFWDHPDAAAVPYLAGAIGLFLLELTPVWDVVSGILFGLAIHSNLFAISMCGLFLAAFVLAAILFRRPLAPLAFRIGWLGVGATLATITGVLYYHRLIGVWNILSPSLEVSLWLSRGGMQQWRLQGLSWISTNHHVLVLPIVAVFILIAWCFQPRHFSVVVLGLYAAGVTLYFYVYQFALKADILQLPYYYVYSLPAIFFGISVFFEQFWGDLKDAHPIGLAALLAVGFLGPWLLKVYWWDWSPRVQMSQFLGLAAATAAILAISALVRRKPTLRLLAVSIGTVAIGVVFAAGFCGSAYSAVFQDHREVERNVYHAAEQLIGAVPKFHDRPGAVCFWYNNRVGNLINSVQSTYLWGYSRCSSPASGVPGLPVIGEFETKMFRDSPVRYVALLGESKDELDQGLAALQKAGIAYAPVEYQKLTSGDYFVYFAYVQLIGR